MDGVELGKRKRAPKRFLGDEPESGSGALVQVKNERRVGGGNSGCSVCGLDENDSEILLCDGCDGEYHMYCLSPPVKSVPNGEFYCPKCTKGNLGTEYKISKRRGKKKRRKEKAMKEAAAAGVTTGTKFRGVNFRVNQQAWAAQITNGGVKRLLGFFESEHEAALAYDRAAIVAQGSRARLNFPENLDKYRAGVGTGTGSSSTLTPKKAVLIGTAMRSSPSSEFEKEQTERDLAKKYRGVTYVEGKFVAQIMREGRMTSLGSYNSAIDAALAHDKAVAKYNIPQVVLNFPNGVVPKKDLQSDRPLSKAEAAALRKQKKAIKDVQHWMSRFDQSIKLHRASRQFEDITESSAIINGPKIKKEPTLEGEELPVITVQDSASHLVKELELHLTKMTTRRPVTTNITDFNGLTSIEKHISFCAAVSDLSDVSFQDYSDFREALDIAIEKRSMLQASTVSDVEKTRLLVPEPEKEETLLVPKEEPVHSISGDGSVEEEMKDDAQQDTQTSTESNSQPDGQMDSETSLQVECDGEKSEKVDEFAESVVEGSARVWKYVAFQEEECEDSMDVEAVLSEDVQVGETKNDANAGAAHTAVQADVDTNVDTDADTSVETNVDTNADTSVNTNVDTNVETSVETIVDTNVETNLPSTSDATQSTDKVSDGKEEEKENPPKGKPNTTAHKRVNTVLGIAEIVPNEATVNVWRLRDHSRVTLSYAEAKKRTITPREAALFVQEGFFNPGETVSVAPSPTKYASLMNLCSAQEEELEMALQSSRVTLEIQRSEVVEVTRHFEGLVAQFAPTLEKLEKEKGQYELNLKYTKFDSSFLSLLEQCGMPILLHLIRECKESVVKCLNALNSRNDTYIEEFQYYVDAFQFVQQKLEGSETLKKMYLEFYREELQSLWVERRASLEVVRLLDKSSAFINYSASERDTALIAEEEDLRNRIEESVNKWERVKWPEFISDTKATSATSTSIPKPKASADNSAPGRTLDVSESQSGAESKPESKPESKTESKIGEDSTKEALKGSNSSSSSDVPMTDVQMVDVDVENVEEDSSKVTTDEDGAKNGTKNASLDASPDASPDSNPDGAQSQEKKSEEKQHNVTIASIKQEIKELSTDHEPNEEKLSTIVLYHPGCINHQTPKGHPECPERLKKAIGVLSNLENRFPKKLKVERLNHAASDIAPSETTLLMVHSNSYLKHLRERSHQAAMADGAPLVFESHTNHHDRGSANVDRIAPTAITRSEEAPMDTYVCGVSWDVALIAAGTVCLAVDRVLQGQCQNAVCLVRPPGHHVGRDGRTLDAPSSGFCLLNNVVIGAMHARQYPSVKKVAVLDWDIHHGNGTEELMRGDKDAFFASVHLFSGHFFPGTGSENSTENLVNVALRPTGKGSGSAAFRAALNEKIFPAMLEFQPDIIFISAGFDGHKDDIIGGRAAVKNPKCPAGYTEEDYSWATKEVLNLASQLSNCRVISVLEGGYDVRKETNALAKSIASHIEAIVTDTH